MNPTIWSYLGIVVGILILSWAAFEVRSRFTRRKKVYTKTVQTWMPLDSNQPSAVREEPPMILAEDEEDAQEDEDQRNLHIRAQQNGHYSPSKKT